MNAYILSFLSVITMSIVTCSPLPCNAQSNERCKEVQLLDGSERIVNYGLDSTRNWWAITSPYDSLYRLHVNGFATGIYQIVYAPRFSYDGEHWASFGMRNNVWYLLYDTTVRQLPGSDVSTVFFTPNSQEILYSYIEGSQEVVVRGNSVFRLASPRIGALYCSQDNKHLCFVTGQTGAKALMMDGVLGQVFDDILPIGYWADGNFVYATRSGSQWRVYRGEEEVAGVFTNVREPLMNLAGTVAAFITTQGEYSMVTMLSDDYIRPIQSRQYQYISKLALHPTLPVYAAIAFHQNSYLALYSGAEYSAGQQGNGTPYFSHDGSEMLYFGCDNDCFMAINGKLTPLNSTINPEGTFAHKPKASTFAYSTSTSLVYRKIEKNELWVSKMCDEISTPRYNWRTDRYEALGRISQRLYLVSCIYW